MRLQANRGIGVLSVILCWVFIGCASKPPEAKPLPAVIASSVDLNPRESGSAQNLDILVFQLSTSDVFLSVDLLELYPGKSQAEAALDGSMVAMNRYQFGPGEQRELEMEIQPEARYIGVVAAFEQYHRATWRALVQLQDETITDKVLFRNKRLYIDLETLSVKARLAK